MKQIKTLIIGAGNGGKSLLEVFSLAEEVEIIGVVDLNPKAPGIELAKKLGIPTFSDWKAALSPEVDLIINVTGNRDLNREIQNLKPEQSELLTGRAARILWGLVQKNKETAEVLKTIYEVGLMLATATNTEETLKEILELGLKLSNCPAGSIALYDSKRKKLAMKVSIGFSDNFNCVTEWEVRPNGLTSSILTNPRPTVVKNVQENPKFNNPVLLKEGIKSLIAVPLTVENEVVGILYVDDFKERVFKEEEVFALSLLANQAALAIKEARFYEEIERLAITDSLTNLFNHRSFYDRLKEEIKRARRYRLNFSVIMIDLDDFKKFNDSYGHLSGDYILKEVGRELKKKIRDTDFPARYGGEEFAIILPQTNTKEAKCVAERIRAGVENLVLKNENKYLGKLTLSAGISTYPFHGTNETEIIGAADKALYLAKKQGKNKVVAFDEIEGEEKITFLENFKKDKYGE